MSQHFTELIERPVIYAHRGASAYAPENTLSAFRLAIEQKADAVELDAKLSADGYVVVFHDQTVDRTTDGSGFISDFLLSTLKELDAGSFFHSRFAGERIPTLDEVFEQVGKQICINVELTNYRTPNDELPERVADLIQKHNLQDRVIISSFLNMNLTRFHAILPGVPVAKLTSPGFSALIARSFIGRRNSPFAINPYYSEVDSAYIQREREYGRKVNVWTVNDPQQIRRMIALDVDGIITDTPLVARQILEQIRG